MKTRKKKRKSKLNFKDFGRPNAVVLIIFSLVVLGVLGSSLIGMRYASVNATTKYVQNLTEQLTSMIDLEISRGRQQLISVGDSFVQVVEKKDDAGVEEFITRKQKLCGFDFIVLEDTRNNRTAMAGIFPDEYAGDTQALKALEVNARALESRECKVGIENEDVIYALPLYDGDVQIGFLWAGNTAESMKNIIRSHSFQEQSYSCIINKDGKLVLSALNQQEFVNLQSVIEDGSDEKLQENAKAMEQNIKNDKSGIFRFTTGDGQKVYLSYAPMEGGNRVMLTIVPTDLLSTDYDRFVYLAAAAVVGTMLVFMCFFILLTRSYRSNREELEKMAFFDEITGGGNNRVFCIKFRELCQKGTVGRYAIVHLDVVEFKEINKKFGIRQGDATLRHLYRIITGCLDKSKGEFVARSEMDRFFLCLHESEPDGVQRRMDAMTEKVNSFERTYFPNYHISFRMAVCFPEERNPDPIVLEDRARSMLKKVDAAPGKCVFYSKEFEEQIRREQELDGAFESAMQSEEFMVYFQPKVSLAKGCVEGAEALVRWYRPKWGIVSPGEFIPVLERSGKILQLDKYVFEKVCEWIKRREADGEKTIPVSVNLSRSHLLNDDFFSWFVETADRYGVPHEAIEFELTESTFMVQDQIQQMRAYITRMHESGFRISIDDFGTGYSAISLLREFDVDVLKLDRTFFLDLDDPKARDVISCLVELAKKLRTRIVVEGIETKKQIAYLKKLHCDVVQGYFFSKPLPEKEFGEWYRCFDAKEYGV